MTIKEWLEALKPQMVEAIADGWIDRYAGRSPEIAKMLKSGAYDQATSAVEFIVPILEAALEQAVIKEVVYEDGAHGLRMEYWPVFRLVVPKDVA